MTASGILPVTSQCGGLLALDRLNPHERSFFVILFLDGRVPNFQSRNGQTLQSFCFTVVAKEHCGSEPFAGPPPAAPDSKLATKMPPGFSHAAMFAINGPCWVGGRLWCK
jgi:hypothetical protein